MPRRPKYKLTNTRNPYAPLSFTTRRTESFFIPKSSGRRGAETGKPRIMTPDGGKWISKLFEIRRTK